MKAKCESRAFKFAEENRIFVKEKFKGKNNGARSLRRCCGRSTIFEFCDLRQEDLAYIVDMSPLRAGKYTPGSHIPIYPLSKLREDNEVTHVVVLAWNYFDSILEQEGELISAGKEFLRFWPTFEVR